MPKTKKCLIFANGRFPGKPVIKKLLNMEKFTIICADGGANSIRKTGIIPDYIIGDMDSITKDTLEFFKGKCRLRKIKGQDDTDVEKCLKFAISKGFKECILVGVIGDRLDHSFGNLSIAVRYSEKTDLTLVTEKSILSVIKGNCIIKTHPGEYISLYGFNERTRITSEGLKYSLKNESLVFGKREGTSNEATGTEVFLKISRGPVFLIREVPAGNKLNPDDAVIQMKK
ncbi:MAG: thiamine diphosphokinase [Syntrophothermus sp.]